uniref:Pellino n=1 Tax=Globodera rostochiensis TaxID=31243 RepID=A0A914HIW9_GLORO
MANKREESSVVEPELSSLLYSVGSEEAFDIVPNDCCYGQLILLGYNGTSETYSCRSNNQDSGRKHFVKMFFNRRKESNGIRKGSVMTISKAANEAPAVKDSTRHTVSYSYGKSGTVLVEYLPDSSRDMFQIGRSSEEQIDFTIVDTWLAIGSPNVSSPAGNSARLIRDDASGQKTISSTISRYACRILADRNHPHKTFIFAAGFNSSRNIFLGEKATKWQKANGEFDGLTTNGVLILHPDLCTESVEAEQKVSNELFVWREVSVDGDIYNLRETRSSMQKGTLVANETNELKDGTLIDLCGATLLWRTAEGLRRCPSRKELEHRLDELNAGKPQCPVNLNTLVIPRRKHPKSGPSSRQPYVYFGCGHVQGKHTWGVNKCGSITTFRCPICMSAFHLNSNCLDYAFNPCGHVASFRTVRFWSRIPLPHGTSSFFPVCPFCTSLLSVEKPFVRLIFQDHCDE